MWNIMRQVYAAPSSPDKMLVLVSYPQEDAFYPKEALTDEAVISRHKEAYKKVAQRLSDGEANYFGRLHFDHILHSPNIPARAISSFLAQKIGMSKYNSREDERLDLPTYEALAPLEELEGGRTALIVTNPNSLRSIYFGLAGQEITAYENTKGVVIRTLRPHRRWSSFAGAHKNSQGSPQNYEALRL